MHTDQLRTTHFKNSSEFLKAMRNTFSDLANLGVDSGIGMFDKRRIRLTNIFSLFGIGILVVFGIMNVAVGDVANALRLLVGIFILYAPVFYLNHLGRIKIARVYLSATTLIFATLIGINSIQEQEQRFNEYLLLGIAAFVLFLFDGGLKKIFFLLAVISGLGMHAYRWIVLFPTVNSDMLLSLSNMSIGFACVYIFSSVFKKELEIAIDQSIARSERIREQSNLIEKRTFMLRAIMDTVPVYIAMTDVNRNFLLVNQWYEKVYDRKASEIEGKPVADFYSPEMNRVHEHYHKRALEGLETEFDQEITLAHTGERAHLFGRMVPMRDEEGIVVAMVEFAADITSVKKIETALNEANQQKDKLISILAHDIRSPLSQLEMLINLGTQSNLSQDQVVEFMQKLKARFEPLNKSINGLLEWSRVQLNGVEVNTESFAPRKIVDEELQILNKYSSGKGLEINIHGNLDSVRMDKEHFRIAVRNLLHNAIKFTPREGCINISLLDDGLPRLTISDSGVGISQEKIDKIMNDQIVKSTPGTDGELGTGLGLNLIKSLLEKNDCSFELKKSDSGTLTELRFPAKS